MFLYHGSHLEVKNPKILTSARTGDFGNGFYLTSNLEQARKWAQIRARQWEVISGVVNIYETPDSLLRNPELQIKQFAEADDEWLDFVISNRKDPNFTHNFDLVTGPVANDRVYSCINAFEDGFMNRETVIEKYKPESVKSILVINIIHWPPYICKKASLYLTGKATFFHKHLTTKRQRCFLKNLSQIQVKTYVLVDQFLFHTAKSLLFLNYLGKEEIPCSQK